MEPTKSDIATSTAAIVPIVPDYELLRNIGSGSYGEVWLARNTATGTLRAVKIVWRARFEDERPFRREFEGIQRFEKISREHPSQLKLFHIGRNEGEGYFYYVMELADRVETSVDSSNDSLTYQPFTLRIALEQGRLMAERTVEIGLALADALGHLHEHGLVHRDVKPSNVIFVNGRPKLADIGLVTDASDRCSIVGTEGYLPPEGPGAPQADIFALGKLLYEAATGFDRRQFPRLPDELRDWPDAALVFEINEIILKACARDSKDRYKTCNAMRDDLALLGRGRSVKEKRGRRKLFVATSWMFALCAVVIFAEVFRHHSRISRPWSAKPAARLLYERALEELQTKKPRRGQRAYDELTKGVEEDPRFLDAYYLMFESKFHGGFVPGGDYRIAKSLFELDPNSAQYHTVNSMIKFDEGRYEDAIAEGKLAIQIDPRLMRTHGLYGWYLELAHGDAKAAMEEYEAAEKIGPPDTIIETIMAGPHCLQHRFDLAIEQLKRAVRLEPDAPEPHRLLVDAYEADKRYEEAINEHEIWRRLSGDPPEDAKGWHDKMLTVLHDKGAPSWWQLQLDSQRQYSRGDSYWAAQINARLGKTNEVMTLLEQAYEERNPKITNLLEDDHWDNYRNEKWFKELLRKVGLHPISNVRPNFH